MKENMLFDGFHKIEEVRANVKGKEVLREKLVLKSAVGGLIIDELNRVGLVTQYRPVINMKTKEIPAGVLDKEGLTPLEVLLEELEEECGISSDEILEINEVPFANYYMIAGSSDATISLYEIRVKEQSNKEIDDAEVEMVEWVDINTFTSYIQEGLVVDGKTLLSYSYLRLNQNKG